MATLKQFAQKLSKHLPRCPQPVVRSQLLEVCRDFCQRTRLWTEQLTAIDVVSGTARYSLSSDNGEVWGVQRAELDETPLDWTDIEAKDRDETTWRTDTADDPDECWYDETTGELVLVETPSADHDVSDDGGLVVWAYLKPDADATTVPNWIYNNHFNTILEGVKADLFAMEDVPWTDLKRAEFHRSNFENETAGIATKRHQGKTAARVRDVLRRRSNIDF